MTDTARLHLPKIKGRRCLATTTAPNDEAGHDTHAYYCTRAWGHQLRHVYTVGTRRNVIWTWS